MKSKARTKPRKSSAVSKKPVQISLDPGLLRRVDADAETRASGRSAFMTSAILLYLRDKERLRVDEEIHRSYAGQADGLAAEAEPIMARQLWPPDDDLVEVGVAAGRLTRRAS
jgi:predicted transcriptional regulator